MSREILVLEDVDAGYGETQVLWRVSMRIEEKSLTALLGSNGAGKTTTLKTIAGLLRPWRGRIAFEGQDITRMPAHRRVELGISLVPEGRGLFAGMSVYENLLMGAYTGRARERIEDSLEFVFSLFPVLRARLGQRAGTLSGGEQQMLAIARGLMSRPRLLMIDEASLGLAPRIVGELMNTVSRIRDEGVTVLLVEQNVHYALRIVDYAYVMETGRIVLEGPRDKVAGDERILKAYMGI